MSDSSKPKSPSPDLHQLHLTFESDNERLGTTSNPAPARKPRNFRSWEHIVIPRKPPASLPGSGDDSESSDSVSPDTAEGDALSDNVAPVDLLNSLGVSPKSAQTSPGCVCLVAGLFY
jgi:hypothetical protein